MPSGRREGGKTVCSGRRERLTGKKRGTSAINNNAATGKRGYHNCGHDNHHSSEKVMHGWMLSVSMEEARGPKTTI